MTNSELTFRTYIAIDVCGPMTATDNRQYFHVRFDEKVRKRRIANHINGTRQHANVSALSRLKTKVFFEDTHAFMFTKCQNHLENPTTPIIIKACFIHTETDPYIIRNSEGKKIGHNSNLPISITNPARLGRKLSFFIMPDEDFMTERRRALKRLEFIEPNE